MSDALEQASLIMVPSGYEDGTLGSLKPLDGSGDFTFARCDGASECDLAATRINEQGYIEKGYENLLYPSNDFSGWANINSILTPNQAGYDGSNDAWLLEATSAQGRRYKSISDTGVLTFSIYAKSGTANILRLRIDAATDMDLRVDLSDGSFVLGTFIDYNIEDAGNGWWRVSVTQNITSPVYIFVYSYDVGSIYIQDAMLNQGLVAYPYIETTTAPVAGGILEDEPRIDFSDGCGHLLLEPSRTNLVPHSEYFGDSSWSKGNIILEANSIASPEGVQNAYKIENTSSVGNHFIRYTITSIIGSTYTLSVFLKKGTKDIVTIADGFNVNVLANFDLTNGTATDVSGTNSSIKAVGADGWYYCSVNIVPTSTILGLMLFSGTDYAGKDTSGYFYAWGAQAEQASYPTSYIPTYGVSQTRLADVCDRGSNLAYTGAYTLYMEFELTKDEVYFLSNTSLAYRLFLEKDDAYFKFGSSNVFFQDMFDWSAALGTNIKMLIYKNGTDAAMFVNGTKYTPSANTLTTGNEVLDWRYINYTTTANRQEQAYIKQLVEFETALSDSECIALTTIS